MAALIHGPRLPKRGQTWEKRVRYVENRGPITGQMGCLSGQEKERVDALVVLVLFPCSGRTILDSQSSGNVYVVFLRAVVRASLYIYIPIPRVSKYLRKWVQSYLFLCPIF